MRSTARRYLSHHLAAEKNDHEGQTDEHSRRKVDAYQAILGSSLPEPEKKPDRVAQEVLTLLVGGSATAMRVMSRIMFHVNSSPYVLSRLKHELDAIMPTPNVHPELRVLEQQCYLVSIGLFLVSISALKSCLWWHTLRFRAVMPPPTD